MPNISNSLKLFKTFGSKYNFFTRLCCNSYDTVQIENDAFVSMKHIKSLNLDIFGLSNFKLKNGSLNGLSNLKKLQIGKCEFDEKDDMIFSSLKNLKYLELEVDNKLNSNIFNNLINLVELNIKHNHLACSIPFNGLNNLQILRVRFEIIKKEQFKELINLKELYLNNGALKIIEKDGFLGLENLKLLDLSDNNLEKLQAYTFNGLSNLEKLYLQGSNFTFIDEDAFGGLFNLKYLYFGEINDKVLPQNVFQHLKNLEESNLFNLSTDYFDGLEKIRLNFYSDEKKQFKMIPHSYLAKIKHMSIAIEDINSVISLIKNSQLVNLSSLSLNYNSNEDESDPTDIYIEKDSLIGLECLKSLSLNYGGGLQFNKFFSFRNLVNLEDIDLSENYSRFNDKNNDLFINLNKLTTLNLSRNYDIQATSSFFNGLHNLKHLDLSEIEEITLVDKIFEHLSSLETLDLSNSKFTEPNLNEMIFYGLTNLKTLILKSTSGLEPDDHDSLEIKDNTFIHLINLIHLDLSTCYLYNIDSNVFNGLSKLQVLNLSVNEIEEMTEEHFKGLISLKQLDLKGNRFVYRKDIAQFYENLNIKDLDLIVF